MPAVARIDPKAVFSADEWSRLTSRSSLRGLWLVAHAWGTIAACIVLVTLWPNPLTWLIAVMSRPSQSRSRPSADLRPSPLFIPTP